MNLILPPPQGVAPWPLLLLSRDPADPFWALAHITMPGDLRPAHLDLAGRYLEWPAIAEWTAARLGWTPEMSPVPDALAWSIRTRRPR